MSFSLRPSLPTARQAATSTALLAHARESIQQSRTTCLANTFIASFERLHISQVQTRSLSTLHRQRKAQKLAPAEFQNGPAENKANAGTSRSALRIQQEAQQARMQTQMERKPEALYEPARPGKRPSGIGHGADHVLFTPAPSMPNAYHTPPKFLPPEDIRRKLFDEQQRRLSTSASTALSPAASHVWPATLPMPPRVRAPWEKKYHVLPEQIEEIRRLKKEDDFKNDNYSLGRKYQCSPFFISMIQRASPEKAAWEKRREATARSKWGPRRRKAREDRVRRREMWGMPE